MSKKGRNKRTSARGHVKGNVRRFRQKTELIPIDEEGRPIHAPVSEIFDRHKLAQSLIDSGGTKPPSTHQPPPPPNNVSSFSEAKARRSAKPTSQTGNEAEALPPDKRKASGSCKHGWLHNTSLAIDEFRSWSKLSRSGERKTYGNELWWYDENRKVLVHTALDDQRKRSIDGHSKPKLKFKKPPSIVHNPMLTPDEPESGGYTADNSVSHGRPVTWYNQQAHKSGSTYHSPSGVNKPKEKAVVYTAEWPFVKEVEPTQAEKPDNSVKVRKTPGIFSDYMRLSGVVRWFIDNVDVQKWPLPMYRFAKFNGEGIVLKHDVIDQVAGDREAELNVLKAMFSGTQRQYRMVDIALTDAQSENNLLRQELALTKDELNTERQANRLMWFEIAHMSGMSPDDVREQYENVIKSKTPATDDADVMLTHYKVFQSFVKCYGPEYAFARYAYGDPQLGGVIRDHANMKAEHREFLFNEREALRRIGSKARERNMNAGYVKYPEIKRFREQAALYRIKNNVKDVDDSRYAKWWKLALDKKSSLYYSRLKLQQAARDSVMIRYWGTEATPFNRKKPVNYQQVINDVVGVRSVEYSNPCLVLYFRKLGFEHKRYMNTRMAKFYLNQTWKGKAVRAVSSVVNFLNTEVNPIKRKQLSEEANQRKLAKAESRKRKAERKAKAVKMKTDGDTAIRHAEQKLHSRGFVIINK